MRSPHSFLVPLAVLILTVALSGTAMAQSAPPAEPASEPSSPAAESETKPLVQGGFSLDRYEDSLFDARAKKIQASISAKRKKKITMLERLMNSSRPSEKMADYIFRLAEAHWEESKYQYLLSRDSYDREYECWEEKRCANQPAEPQEDYGVALDLYRKVLREHPSYRRIDEVYYYLGRAALKAGKDRKDRQLQNEGVKRLNDLVQKFSTSRFVAQTHLALAEHHFETDSLFYAKQNYEKIIFNHQTSSMFNYALYKLGWVYFNLTEFEQTVDTFKRVIKEISGGGGNRATIEFRAQALNDLVVTWAEIEDGWRSAREYFMVEIGEVETYKKLDRMAGLLVSKDKDEEAISLYKHLIAYNDVAKKVVEYYDAVLEVRRKIGDMDEIEREINEIVGVFEHKGKWWLTNKSDNNIAKRADEIVGNNLIYLANHFHRGAQKLDDQRRTSMPWYTKASHYYKMFLDRFPTHKDAYVLSFYYAEILYDKLGDYANAAVQYEAVISQNTKGEYMEDAALGVIYAVERIMGKEGLRAEAKGGKIEVVKTETSDTERLKKGELKPIPRTELHDLERRYVRAADKYVELLKEALADPKFRKKYPKRGKMIPEIMFIAAQTFYSHGQFKQAVERLMIIFDLYPGHKMANIAVNTIIDAYARLKRWEKIESWARKLIRARNFKVKTKSELEQMIGIAKTEHARDLTKQRKFDEAVRVQSEIVEEFGRKNKKLASIALYNIGIIHETARRFGKAVLTFEDVVKRYPKEDVAVEAQFEIGVLWENQTQFEKAAEAFIKMEKFKTNPKAKDAIKNAALIYEALEKYDLAHKTFKRYLKLFPTADDAAQVAFHSAEVLEFGKTAKDYTAAGKSYEKVGKTHGRKDLQYKLRATSAAGNALKKADKRKNRRKVEKLFKATLKHWSRLNAKDPEGKSIKASTKAYAGLAALELAEYKYDDYAKMTLQAINKRGKFDVRVLKKSLKAKAESMQEATKAFDRVLEFKDPGMAAAASFRLGQLYYEFAQSLFNAPIPDQIKNIEDEDLREELIAEYQFQLSEAAAPLEEKALVAFTLALKQALDKNVYNKWSRKSAEFAAKVNKTEFPISVFRVSADKTKDTLTSTNFVRVLREGDVVVDFAE